MVRLIRQGCPTIPIHDAAMVSLFEILLRKPLWSHLTSGIPTLDAMLNLQSDAILDFQTVPTHQAFYVMLCHMICSHLSKSDDTTVVVLQTINDFPWQILRQHAQFQSSWISDNRITQYNLASFSKLYAFFKLMPLPQTSGSTLMLITNFHELLELYRYQFAATHEEYMLKHQIEQYSVLLENREKAEEEGIESVELPQIPSNSMLRENPYFRCQTHIHELFSAISSWSVKSSSVVLLLGHMEPKFLAPQHDNIRTVDSSQASLSNSSQLKERRLTFAPVVFGDSRGDKKSPSESKISCKLLFYSDWYFHSPHFKSESRAITTEDQYLVSVVKVMNVTGSRNITEPIYFDFKTAPSADGTPITSDCFLNLSDTQANEHTEGLSSLLQETMSSTQVYSRNSSDPKSPAIGRATKFSMPSSPPANVPVFVASQMPPQPLTDNEDIPSDNDFPSVIDSSDVESTGTLLEDMEENYSSDSSGSQSNDAEEETWLARHS